MRFYVPGISSAAFTYDIASTDGSDHWEFRLRQFNVAQTSLSVNTYPTLQLITYDFRQGTLNGTCTVPTSNGNLSTVPCMVGTFDISSSLTFDLTSAIPLNNTSNTSSVPSVRTLLSSSESEWTWENYPGFILNMIDAAKGSASAEVLRTSSVKVSDCTQQKVCISGIEGRVGGAVGAEVLAPLGVALIQESRAAIACSSPHGGRYD